MTEYSKKFDLHYSNEVILFLKEQLGRVLLWSLSVLLSLLLKLAYALTVDCTLSWMSRCCWAGDSTGPFPLLDTNFPSLNGRHSPVEHRARR